MDSISKIIYTALTTDEPQFKIAKSLMNECKSENSIDVNEILIHICYKDEDPSTEVIQFLIDNGADINYQCKKHGSTPIMYLAQRGKTNQVKYLINMGADLFIINKGEKDVFFFAHQGTISTKVLLENTKLAPIFKNLKKENQELKEENDFLKSVVKNLETMNNLNDEKIMKLETENLENSKLISKLKDEIAELKDEIYKKNTDITNLQTKFVTEINEIGDENIELVVKNEKLYNQLEELQEKFDLSNMNSCAYEELDYENHYLTEEMTKLKLNHENLQKKYNKTLKDLNNFKSNFDKLNSIFDQESIN